MTAKLDYRWRLREVMAHRGMFSTTNLRPLLAERGIDLSPSQTYRLVAERPERLSLKTLMALLDVLGCAVEDLIEPVPAAGSLRRTKKAAGAPTPPAGGAPVGLGDFRPRRARIVCDQDTP
ncbi:helix-turn-helix domain-containing protein [Streptomyces sp. NPDC048248]|uniref:helix-turn-helix domain-containing protein n=1 Tax=Streptomyces sp. NPDC048248 TaxID=3365523 RepID=UPI00371D404B